MWLWSKRPVSRFAAEVIKKKKNLSQNRQQNHNQSTVKHLGATQSNNQKHNSMFFHSFRDIQLMYYVVHINPTLLHQTNR